VHSPTTDPGWPLAQGSSEHECLREVAAKSQVEVDAVTRRRCKGDVMSARTRANRIADPGAAAHHKPSSDERKTRQQRTRRAEHVALTTAVGGDYDDLIIPEAHRTAMSTTPQERPHAGTPEESKPRFKVWKTKMWKRRVLTRTQRNLAEQQRLREL
jgi:hypothetical protein